MKVPSVSQSAAENVNSVTEATTERTKPAVIELAEPVGGTAALADAVHDVWAHLPVDAGAGLEIDGTAFLCVVGAESDIADAALILDLHSGVGGAFLVVVDIDPANGAGDV